MVENAPQKNIRKVPQITDPGERREYSLRFSSDAHLEQVREVIREASKPQTS